MTGKKVLIVDDDTRNIFALTAVLKAKGYSCITSPGSLEALKLLSSNHEVGIVLLDMMMPDMDGYEMLTTLRKGSNADLPVIAVTAQAMLGDREKCLAAGADDYVSKPVDIDKLVDILDKYLQK
ncbi:MAG TPA: response regulator [Cyclobacteriaceae bacterium]|nr:response regulator [Cyclobacteriaceae bacterium]HMV11112.1 response regulator [Cyclobacteriaceae bacterium]HMV88939.1 response regulator [Cyclobacteriaceae bacterium]HMX01100.1 response regulator [Cyclobacteriaceae bacterium]HMX51916.1 response regulator [Cyclobacteriaceae bacterium]